LSARSSNGETIDNLRSTSIDYYSSLRSIYLQNRGINTSEDIEKDINFFDEDFDDENIFFPEVKNND
jgi:ABC-type transporter lipoprotein component MlaA